MDLTERPPSQRGVEYDLVDQLRTLSDDLAELRLRLDRRQVDPTNWWDVLDPLANPHLPGSSTDWSQIFRTGYQSWQPYTAYPGTYAELRWAVGSDRIELTLLVDQRVVWQRTLFFSPRPFGGGG